MLGGLLRKEDDVHIAKLRLNGGLGTFASVRCTCPSLFYREKGPHFQQKTPHEHERYCHHLHYSPSVHRQPPSISHRARCEMLLPRSPCLSQGLLRRLLLRFLFASPGPYAHDLTLNRQFHFE